MLETKELIDLQINELWKIIKDNTGSKSIDNSLVKLFRGLTYELKSASRDKKILKLQ